jgi:YidC/Oxa1 family membrane protein insertase
LYDVADAVAAAAADTTKSSSGFLSPLTDTLEDVLKNIQNQLDKLHVPYSYGYSIIVLTMLVKAVTFPLTKKQASSAASGEGCRS